MPTPWPVWTIAGVLLAVLSAATFALFAIDKRRAARGRFRVSEKLLLTACLVGGWPGGLVAMKVCRHKTRTPAFRFGVPLIGAAHVLGWIALVWLAAGRPAGP